MVTLYQSSCMNTGRMEPETQLKHYRIFITHHLNMINTKMFSDKVISVIFFLSIIYIEWMYTDTPHI